VAELAPQDAQRVFEQVLRRFIGVFARPEHPLALFLDDLQWLDTATLDLIQHLLQQDEVESLFLVGAYRDNEVGPEHPLARRLDVLREAGARVSEIALGPLALFDVRRLIADTLHDEHVWPLAELVQHKTAGNPLFTIQFLTALADDGLITFEPGARRWTWDLSRIAARGFTDNVVALMIEKITRLPAACRETMQVLACLGNTARVEALAAALDREASAVHLAVSDAVHSGLVAWHGGAYTFLHDRVQEASYALISEADRPSAHLRVGWRLLARARRKCIRDRQPTQSRHRGRLRS
jgi:predicted ATPase